MSYEAENPGGAEEHFNMGRAQSEAGHLEEALALFRKAVALGGGHAGAYRGIGLICEKMGRNREAADNFEKAAEIHLENYQNEEAEELLNAALALRPDTEGAHNCLGIVYRRQGRLSEALRAYEKAVRARPDDEYIYFNAARVYLDMGNSVMARKYLRQATKINPDFSGAVDLLRATEMGLNIKI